MKHEGSSGTILRGIRRFVGEYEIPIGVALNHNSSLHQDAIWFIHTPAGCSATSVEFEAVPESVKCL